MFSKRKTTSHYPSSYLDHVVLNFNRKNLNDSLTVRDLCNGIQIFGAPGSGKTSGAGKFLVLNLLERMYGGIVMCAKVGETERWLDHMAALNQLDRAVVFGHPETCQNYKEKYSEIEAGYHHFNALFYLDNKPKEFGGNSTEELVKAVMLIIRLNKSIIEGGIDANMKVDFWIESMLEVITHTFNILKLARDYQKENPNDQHAKYALTFYNISRMLSDAPHQDYPEVEDGFLKDVLEDAANRVDALQDLMKLRYQKGWKSIRGVYDEQYEILQSAKQVYEDAENYFLVDFYRLADKTRSGVVQTFRALTRYFRGDGLMAKRFSRYVSPELDPKRTFTGDRPKVIILDFPSIATEEGLLAQSLYKQIWQKEVETRRITASSMPCFYWADEAQRFLDGKDAKFFETAREAKCMCVLITQNINGYASVLRPAQVNSILGLLNTKIFLLNTDAKTNEYASALIGSGQEPEISYTYGGSNEDVKMTISNKEQRLVKPYDFANLYRDFKDKKVVQGVIHTGGMKWSNEKSYMDNVFFDLNYEKKYIL